MDSSQLRELTARMYKLEKRDVQDFLTLLELMSNVHFFGGMKRTNCECAKEGQCNLFHLENKAKNKVPVATECRIRGCNGSNDHCHLEVSNITCTFCPLWNSPQSIPVTEKKIEKRENYKCQEE